MQLTHSGLASTHCRNSASVMWQEETFTDSAGGRPWLACLLSIIARACIAECLWCGGMGDGGGVSVGFELLAGQGPSCPPQDGDKASPQHVSGFTEAEHTPQVGEWQDGGQYGRGTPTLKACVISLLSLWARACLNGGLNRKLTHQQRNHNHTRIRRQRKATTTRNHSRCTEPQAAFLCT